MKFHALAPLCAVISLIAVSGCSSEDSLKRGDAPKGWRVCETLFGAEKVDAMQRDMGSGTLRVENQLVPVDDLMSGIKNLAQRWQPGSEAHYATTDRPCDLALEGTGKRFESSVRWSMFSLDDIKAGDAGSGWQSVNPDVMVKRGDGGLRWNVTFSCKVTGAHQRQESDLPLEVEARVRGLSNVDETLLKEMTTRLAENLIEGVPCVNRPAVPDSL